MRMSLYNISIGRRVSGAFIFTTVIAMVVMSLLSFYYFNALVTRDQAVKTAFTAQHNANDQLVNLQRMNALLRTRLAQVFATTGGTIQDPSLAASGELISTDILTREITFEQMVSFYQQNYALNNADAMNGVRAIVYNDDPKTSVGASQQAALTSVAKSEWPRYRILQDQVLQLLDPAKNLLLGTNPAGAYEQVYALQFEANTLFISLANNWQQVVNSAETIGEIVTNVGPSQTQPILIATSFALLFTFLVILLVGYMVNGTITRPLHQLVVLTKRVAAGENYIRAKVRGRDEVAQVATSMNGMLDHIAELIQESEHRRSRLKLLLEQLVRQVRGVSYGDLRVHADVEEQELGVLATSFNYMVEEFSTLIRQVKGVASQVVFSTSQISPAMMKLVESADQQIIQIQNALTSVQQMTSANQSIDQKATGLSTIASRTCEAAKEGSKAAHAAIDAIERVNNKMQATALGVKEMQEQSSLLNEIATTMGGLAQKIQLLALNAASQLGLSGETNPGFAEIVKEIRRLSDQTKEDTKKIALIAHTIIGGMAELQRTTYGTATETLTTARFASQAGNILEKTVDEVAHQADEIQRMAMSASEQVKLSSGVVNAMQHVSQVTDQNRNSIRMIGLQVKRQEQYVTQLNTSVAVFIVSDEQNSNGGRNLVKLLNRERKG